MMYHVLMSILALALLVGSHYFAPRNYCLSWLLLLFATILLLLLTA